MISKRKFVANIVSKSWDKYTWRDQKYLSKYLLYSEPDLVRYCYVDNANLTVDGQLILNIHFQSVVWPRHLSLGAIYEPSVIHMCMQWVNVRLYCSNYDISEEVCHLKPNSDNFWCTKTIKIHVFLFRFDMNLGIKKVMILFIKWYNLHFFCVSIHVKSIHQLRILIVIIHCSLC